MSTKSIVRYISAGPGELDVITDIFRRRGSNHLYFTFESADESLESPGGRWPVTVNSVTNNGIEEHHLDGYTITGVVMFHNRNRNRYHHFTATYNFQTRRGEAVFETTCRDCGADVNNYGVCTVCDPCDICDRRDCQPHRSCCLLQK